MPAAPDDSPRPNDHGADRRIRTGVSKALLGFAPSSTHPFFVGGHHLAVYGLPRPDEISNFTRMSLGPRAKYQLYHSLTQLLRAGITFPAAIEKLSRTAPHQIRSVLAIVQRSLSQGRTVAEACTEAHPAIGAMETAVLVGVERAGRLDRGLEQLAHYFDAMAKARSRLFGKLTYPVFILIFGVLVLNAPLIFTKGTGAFLRASVPTLGVLAVIAALVFFGAALALRLAAIHRAPDALVRALPMVGGMHRAFAMTRFCLAYDVQLEAGVNTLNALQAGADASRSALVHAAVVDALEEVRRGSKPGEFLAASGAFSPDVTESIIVGEESGQLGEELRRQAALQQTLAFSRLDLLADWFPRAAYLVIVVFLGYRIIATFQSVMGQYRSVIDGM